MPKRLHSYVTQNATNDLVGEIVCGSLLFIIFVNSMLFDFWHDVTGVKQQAYFVALGILTAPLAFGFFMYRAKIWNKLNP